MKFTPVEVIRDPRKATLVIVGCGGTGGYVLQQAARLAYALKEQQTNWWESHILLIDGDTVDEHNLMRQYFLPKDIGRNKAQVLAQRYGRAYGLPIGYHSSYLNQETELLGLIPNGAIVVGCVDNAPTRRLLHERLRQLRDVIYIDAGNSAQAPGDPAHLDRYELAKIARSGWEGQVLTGVRRAGEDILPFPGEMLPDLLEGDEPLPDSCEEVAAGEPQRHMTNLMAATCVMMNLYPLLSTGHMITSRTFFDARSGFVRSDPAVDMLLEVKT